MVTSQLLRNTAYAPAHARAPRSDDDTITMKTDVNMDVCYSLI